VRYRLSSRMNSPLRAGAYTRKVAEKISAAPASTPRRLATAAVVGCGLAGRTLPRPAIDLPQPIAEASAPDKSFPVASSAARRARHGLEASAPEKIEEQTQHDADEDAGCEREVERHVVALVVDVARELAQPRDLAGDGEEQAERHQHAAEENEQL